MSEDGLTFKNYGNGIYWFLHSKSSNYPYHQHAYLHIIYIFLSPFLLQTLGAGVKMKTGVREFSVQDMLKPQDSFGRFVNIFLDLQKVDHTIRKHH